MHERRAPHVLPPHPDAQDADPAGPLPLHSPADGAEDGDGLIGSGKAVPERPVAAAGHEAQGAGSAGGGHLVLRSRKHAWLMLGT